MYEKAVQVKMLKLSEYLKKEVLDYVEFLLSKYQNKKVIQKKFNFDWEGGLSDIKENFTSIELQHKALRWR